jgi:penicillin amidase
MREDCARNRRHALLITIVAGICTIFLSSCFTLTRPAVPRVRGTVLVEGLDGPVEIYRDSSGIPHIIASSDDDAFFAQGYVHAQDRFFQMHLWRLIGAGRLSELFGELLLESDIYLRTMGFREVTRREYETAPPLMKRALDAYAAGVNAYIADRTPKQLAAEFALLGLLGTEIEIDPWTPLDSLTWPKLMSYALGADAEMELLRLDIIRAVGIDMARDYFPLTPYDETPTVLDPDDFEVGPSASVPIDTFAGDLALFSNPEWVSAVAGFASGDVITEERARIADLWSGAFGEKGSNQWVISGRYTASGMPQYANDVHLEVQTPGLWYALSLHVTGADGWNCHGYSLTTVPGIVIGHNTHMVWGMSTARVDVQDLYVEQINPNNTNEYRVGDQWVPMEVHREVIRIADADPYFLEVRSTRNGPIVTDHGGYAPYSSFDVRPVEIFPTDMALTELSLRWTALDPMHTVQAVLLYDRARTIDEFREALSYFDVPSHNYIYADVEGNIAYFLPGKIPIRPNGYGTLPVPGWDDAYQWAGFVPYEQMPSTVNPERGYIISCNNAVSPPGYEVFSEHLHYFEPRAPRATELVQAAISDGAVGIADHEAIQQDTLNVTARSILPMVLAVDEQTIRENVALESRLLTPGVDTDEEEAELAELTDKRVDGALAASRILEEWDMRMETDSIAPTVFSRFAVELFTRIFTDQIPPEVWEGPWRAAYGPHLLARLNLLVDEPDNIWWDDTRTPEVRETRDDIMARALSAAYETLIEEYGENTARWEWGRVHTVSFMNETLGRSGVGFVERMFNRGPVAVAGGLSVLFRNEFDVLEPFSVHHTASLRMIADLSDWSATEYIHYTGQSGHPASRHYDDLIDDWATGQYRTHPWTLEEIRAQARDVMTLEPAQ